jgi:hypothetical protein
MLTGLLHLVESESRTSDFSLSGQQLQQLDSIFEGCEADLNGLGDLLDKYRFGPGFKHATRRIFKLMTWDQEPIRHFQERFSSRVNALNLFITHLNRYIKTKKNKCQGEILK